MTMMTVWDVQQEEHLGRQREDMGRSQGDLAETLLEVYWDIDFRTCRFTEYLLSNKAFLVNTTTMLAKQNEGTGGVTRAIMYR